MAATIDGEKYATRQLSGDRAERVYLIRNTDDDVEARALLLATAPLAIVTNGRTIPIDLDATEVLEIEDNIWNGTVSYRRGGGSVIESGQFKLSYDITVQNYTLFVSRETKEKKAGVGFVVTDFNQVINVNGSGGADGVDYQVPVMTGTVEKIFPEEQITESYIGNLYATVGTVNASPYRGLQAGEGLLTGVSGNDNGDGTWTFNFTYAISPNETNMSIGNGITIENKSGWDYLWVLYQALDNPAIGVIPKPAQANVERIYRWTNWGVLNA